MFQDDVLTMRLDNTTSTEVHALDNRRLQTSTGVRPVKSPTSGG